MSSHADTTLPYVIYARKSSESEDRQVLSIDSQVKELKDYAEAKGITVADVLTEARSAKTTGRPVFDLMIKQIVAGKIGGVISWKLDRLSRNPLDGARLIQALEANRLKQIVTPGQTYQNTTNDKFSLSIELCLAKRYVDDLSDNVKRGNRAKLERGWLPGPAPLGYLNDTVNKTIVKDPERFALVRKLWDMALAGNQSISKIVEALNRQLGLRSRGTYRGEGRPLSKSGAYHILANPFYYGLITRRGEVFQGSHQPMVTKREFDRVQELLHRPGKPKIQHREFSFTGLIRCGECGAMVTAEETKNRYGNQYVYYHCTKRLAGGRCSQKYIRQEELECQMVAILDDLSIHDEFKHYALKRLRILHLNECTDRRSLVATVDKAIEQAQKRLDNLLDMRLREMLDDDEYNRRKRSILEEVTELKEKREDLNLRQTHWFELSESAFLFANMAKFWFEIGDRQRKREIIACLGSNFYLKDKSLLIEAKKPFLIIKEGSVIPNWLAAVDDVRTFFMENQVLWQIPKWAM